jgi:hypothetical protein
MRKSARELSIIIRPAIMGKSDYHRYKISKQHHPHNDSFIGIHPAVMGKSTKQRIPYEPLINASHQSSMP